VHTRTPSALSTPALVLVLAGVLPGVLASCADDALPEAGFRVETLGGIEHTVTTNVPEQGGQGLELLWSAPDEARVLDGSEWANPTRIAVNDRYVAVLDPQLPRVHLFAISGEPAGGFGRRGEGPGELARPGSVAVDGDSILVVSALTSPGFQWFRMDGGFLGSPGGTGSGTSAAAHFLPGTGLVRQIVDLQVSAPGMGWEFLHLSGDRTPVELPGDHPLQPHVVEGGTGCWRLGAAGPHLAQVDCTFPLVRIVDAEGRVLREHRIEWDPQRTPDPVVDAAIDSLEASMQVSSEGIPPAMAAQMIGRFAEQMRTQYAWLPVMHTVTGSTSGHRIVLLEQLPDNLGGGAGTVHVLDDQGRYLARHAFDRAVRSIAASDTRLVVLLQDDLTGLRRLEAYALP
jgi:hypothetical protein